jgi:N-methylhydantoinase B
MYASGEQLTAGDHLTFASNGGGGFGDPLERDPAAVLEDYADGLISEQKARDVYGVAVRTIDEDAAEYAVDEEETARLRRELAGRERTVGYAPWEVHPYGQRVE